MSDERLSIFEWAKRYVGDPASWETRGIVMLDFLRDEGLEPRHRVLEVGCGCLSSGLPLLEFLDDGCYVGIEPNGWLVEAALAELSLSTPKTATFLWRSDFDAAECGVLFDFAIAHSILSHAADHQLAGCLLRVRDVMRPGGVFLASLRLGDHDTHAQTWVYPDVAFFTFDTVERVAGHAGFRAEVLPEHRERMVRVAPNDLHDWVRFTAVDAPRFHAEHVDADICPLARAERSRADDALERERSLFDVAVDLTGTLEALLPLSDAQDDAELSVRARTSHARGASLIRDYAEREALPWA